MERTDAQRLATDVATEELESQHRHDLLYADRQRLKAGDAEGVAESLRRRKSVALNAALLWAALWVFMGHDFYAALGVVLAALELSKARRTHETIVRWRREAGGPEPRPDTTNPERTDPRDRLQYAEKQALDAGDHGAVARSLRKRARVRLAVGLVIAMVYGSMAALADGPLEDRIFGFVVFATILGLLVVDTLRTERLVKDVEALPWGGAADARAAADRAADSRSA